MAKSLSYKATNIESFKTGINNLEYIIDYSGPDAQKAIKKMDKDKKLNLGQIYRRISNGGWRGVFRFYSKINRKDK